MGKLHKNCDEETGKTKKKKGFDYRKVA